MASEPHVTLSGDIVGEYVVKDRRPDGELRLVPDEYPATVPKYGGRRATPEEFEAFVAEHDILPRHHPRGAHAPTVYDIAHRRLNA